MTGSIGQTIRRSLLFCPACNARLRRGTRRLTCPRCDMQTGPSPDRGTSASPAKAPGLSETLLIDRCATGVGDDVCDPVEAASDWAERMVGSRLGGYRLEALLGEGGMGAVFLARHLDLGRRTAVKVLSPDKLAGNRDYHRRFRDEARTASALIHPNVVTTHAVGSDGDTHFIEMEFVAGRSLQHHLERYQLSCEEAARLIGQVADGLAAAHRDGLLHRDLKPDNILLTHSRTAKLGDFGLAKPLRLSRPGDLSYLVGTPHYMAPELFRGESPGPAADVYSLGVCLFTMLAGHPPHRAENFEDLVHAVQTRPMPGIRDVRADVSLEMAECVAMLTEPGARNRPADGIAAASLIHSLLGHLRDVNDLVLQGVGDDPCVDIERTSGGLKLHVRLPGSRRQTILVDESQDPLAERLVRFSSVCGPADPQQFDRVLRMNGRIAHGAIAVRTLAGVDRFVMVDSYPAGTLDPEEVRRTVWEVAVYADELERELTGDDQH